jgi:superfamily I DNA and/or RNA helicase
MEVSLFEHVLDVYGDEVSTLLRKQYRMHRAIAAFPNEAFYGGKLTHGQRNRAWTVGDLDPLVGIQVDGDEQETPGGSYYNEAEAAVVVDEVDRLRRNGVPASRIGVITPYSGQVGKIVQALDDDELAERVDVATVDSFQGGEREAIVVSFVRSNDRGDTGFLTFPHEGPRRLNVAMTRAQKRCALVGDWSTLRATPSHRSPDEDASHVFDALYDHLEERDSLVQVAAAIE